MADRTLTGLDPGATMTSFQAAATDVHMTASEGVPATLAIWLPPRIVVSAACSGRLRAGYSSPSS
jgi:anti-sigma factor RsiW